VAHLHALLLLLLLQLLLLLLLLGSTHQPLLLHNAKPAPFTMSVHAGSTTPHS